MPQLFSLISCMPCTNCIILFFRGLLTEAFRIQLSSIAHKNYPRNIYKIGENTQGCISLGNHLLTVVKLWFLSTKTYLFLNILCVFVGEIRF